MFEFRVFGIADSSFIAVIAALGKKEASVKSDVGVLLVHGIGDHQEGTTLTSFGEPIIDWIREWLWGDNRFEATNSKVKHPLNTNSQASRAYGDAQVIDARLRALRTEAESPASARVALTAGNAKRSKGNVETWLFCEAWWGSSVLPPTSVKLLGWLWARTPLLIYWHFYIGSRRPISKSGTTAANVKSDTRADGNYELHFSGAIAALSLSFVCQFVVAIAIVLWFIPVERWRRAVIAATRVLTLTLGDSYALLEQDIQSAALVDRVGQSLRWLSERAEKIVVIAHSQGAALAYDAVLKTGDVPVNLLITIGSGLEKLQFLRAARFKSKGVVMAAILCPMLLCGVGFGIGAFFAREKGLAIIAASLLAAAFVAHQKLVSSFGDYYAEIESRLRHSRPLASEGWIDIYASHDAVPAGDNSILAAAGMAKRVKVANGNSILGDHTSYFKNKIGAMSAVWQSLALISNLPLLDQSDQNLLNDNRRLQNRRGRLLTIVHTASLAALGCFLLARSDALLALGEMLDDLLTRTAAGGILRPFRWCSNLFITYAMRLSAGEPIEQVAVTRWLLGSFGVLIVFFIWWICVSGLWKAFSGGQWEWLCRNRIRRGGAARIAFEALNLTSFGALSSVCLSVLVISIFHRETITLHFVSDAIAFVFALLMLAAALGLLTLIPWLVHSYVIKQWKGIGKQFSYDRKLKICWDAVWMAVSGMFIVVLLMGFGIALYPAEPPPIVGRLFLSAFILSTGYLIFSAPIKTALLAIRQTSLVCQIVRTLKAGMGRLSKLWRA